MNKDDEGTGGKKPTTLGDVVKAKAAYKKELANSRAVIKKAGNKPVNYDVKKLNLLNSDYVNAYNDYKTRSTAGDNSSVNPINGPIAGTHKDAGK